jgi:hypothetical protein
MKELIERIAASYSIEDILYVLGKDEEWLLWRIKDELLRHKEDFMYGDDFYTGVYDE